MSVSGRSGERSDLIPRRHVSRTGGLAGGPVRLGDPNRGLSAENFRNTTSCGRFDERSGMAGTFRQETSGRRSHTTPAGGSRHLRVRVTIAQSVRVHRLAAPTAGPLAQPQLVGRSRRAPHAVRPNEPPSHPGQPLRPGGGLRDRSQRLSPQLHSRSPLRSSRAPSLTTLGTAPAAFPFDPVSNVPRRRTAPLEHPVCRAAHIDAERQIRRAHTCRFPFGQPAGPPVRGEHSELQVRPAVVRGPAGWWHRSGWFRTVRGS